jgi:hypothetical protein
LCQAERVDEKSILDRIAGLVEEEHLLRGAVLTGDLSAEEERERLRSVEIALDQCWDLLRRRRAAQSADQNPDAVQARPVSEVEGYLQ